MSKKDYRELDRPIDWAKAPTPTPKKLTAYEELKAWCEKHLEPREYIILPETKSYGLSIVLEDEYEIGFYSDGRFLNIWGVDDDTIEHAKECEAYERAKR